MGFLRIMIFMICAALVIYLASYNCSNGTCTWSNNVPIITILTQGVPGAIAVLTTFFQGPNALFNIAAGAVAVVAAFFTIYPNPWVIFFAPAVYLFTWSLTPIQLFNANNIGLSDPNSILAVAVVGSIFQISATLLLLSWFKGQESMW